MSAFGGILESLGPTRIQKRGDGKKVSGNRFASSSLLSICDVAAERIFSSVSNRKPQLLQDQKFRISCSSLKNSANSGAGSVLPHSRQITSILEIVD
jgi:hypothetical protein